MLPVPPFLRRFWRLFEARRALVDGAPEDALVHLRDPALALSGRADALRRRAMDVLYRDVARKASEGRDASVARLLSVAATEDPRRAEEWRRSLEPERPPTGSASGPLRELLARMRSERGERPDEAAPRPAPAPARAALPAGAALRFQLAVDDGGAFLVVAHPAVTIGHARAARADVPVLADLESLHARFVYGTSFHGGPRWSVEPLGRGHVELDGERLAGPRTLVDGDVLRLAPNLALRFRRPDPASASAVLELSGAEAEGAQRVLLLVPGVAGRVRIGALSTRHVPVAGLEHEVELRLEPQDGPDTLTVRCAGGVRLLGVDPSEERAAEERALPCPPAARLDLVLGARPSQRPPFGLALSPLDPPTMTGGA